MKFEYTFVTLELSEGEQQLAQMGLADIQQLNTKVRDTINEHAANGWEPMYPFSVPSIWFRKQKTATRKKKTSKRA